MVAPLAAVAALPARRPGANPAFSGAEKLQKQPNHIAIHVR